MWAKFYYFFCILSFLGLRSSGQQLDSITTNLYQYGLKNSESILFVHFDKNVYTNNDQVWFTGYLLTKIVNFDNYHTLHISLVNNSDSSIVLQDQFLINNGICFGNLTLPDSLPSGNYRFVANTNIKFNNKFDGEFIQPITIKSTTINSLTASISIFKENDEKTKNGTALLKVLTSDNRFVEGAEIKYSIGRKNLIKEGRAKSNVIGELMIDYPTEQITPENNLLTISVKKGSEIRYIKYDLPFHQQQKYEVRFFPEGGYLVDGVMNRIGFEIKDINEVAIETKALLFENDRLLDTVETNSSGIGSFPLNPNNKLTYTVKLLSKDSLPYQYFLPKALQKGISIVASQAIANNELKIRLQSNFNTKVHVMVHNYLNIKGHTELNLASKVQQGVRFLLDSVPIGLNTITILDSLYRPIAERIFFAHYDQLNHLIVETDKEEYVTREQVELKLSVKSTPPNGTNGMVSIACVQANRLLLANNTNIIDYSFFQKELGNLPPQLSSSRFTDINYLNDILLVKGWSRYKWPLEKQTEENSIVSMEYTGEIKKGKKELQKPMELTTIVKDKFNIINTDSIGRFSIPMEYLITDEKRKIWLSINDKNFKQYTLEVNDPLKAIKTYLNHQDYKSNSTAMAIVNDESQSITNRSGTRLKEVVIKAKNDYNVNYASANKCGDYVCMYNILNCPNHRFERNNKMPIQGVLYKTGGGSSVRYAGCNEQMPKPNFYLLNSVRLAKEFYISDISNKEEPINFATVYWSYQTKLEDNKTIVKFNTGDLTGRFKIVVQGVAENGLVYGEKFITIKRP